MNAPECLTRRQAEVFLLCAEGKTQKDIAKALGLSSKTVNAFLAGIAERLNLSEGNRAVFVAHYAIAKGFVQPILPASKEVATN